MTKFTNQTVGSYNDKTNRNVEVWWDSNLVTRFAFHSVGTCGILGAYHLVYGMSVDARYVWAATKAFSCVTNIMAVRPDGSEFYVHWVSLAGDVEEFRAGGRYGPAVARMRPIDYVQGLSSSLIEA